MNNKPKQSKTISDVTIQEWSELAESAIELLGAARLLYWQSGKESSDDTSYKEAIDRMAEALNAIGLKQVSTEQFNMTVEKILNTPPEQFVKQLESTRVTR